MIYDFGFKYASERDVTIKYHKIQILPFKTQYHVLFCFYIPR